MADAQKMFYQGPFSESCSSIIWTSMICAYATGKEEEVAGARGLIKRGEDTKNLGQLQHQMLMLS